MVVPTIGADELFIVVAGFVPLREQRARKVEAPAVPALRDHVELPSDLLFVDLARAMRVDKLTLAALEATLTGPPAPVSMALTARRDDLLARARRITEHLGTDLAEAVVSEGAVGGGGAPGVVLPSAAVALPPALAGPLRTGDPAVLGHVTDGRLLLDLLMVPETFDEAVVEAVRRAVDAERA